MHSHKYIKTHHPISDSSVRATYCSLTECLTVASYIATILEYIDCFCTNQLKVQFSGRFLNKLGIG